MKKLMLLLTTSAILTGCGQYTKTYEMDCKNYLPAAEQTYAAKVVRKLEITISTLFGDAYKEDTSEIEACHIVTCQQNAVLSLFDLTSHTPPEGAVLQNVDSNRMNSKVRSVCVPQKTCESLELGSGTTALPFIWDLDRLYLYETMEIEAISLVSTVYDAVNYDTSSCVTSEECGEGQVLNTATELCVNVNEPCNEEDLPPGSNAGVMIFDIVSNSYGMCQPTGCGPGFMLMGPVCVPFMDPCMIAPTPACPGYCAMFPGDPMCGGGPETCEPGEVLNSDTELCVLEETPCTEEELTGIGAETGHKVFNTFSNEYDLCQADTCVDGYTLGLGICNPDAPGGGGAIYGCMDSRAANYMPEATEDDMSCVCGPGSMPWNPITGCEDIP